MKTGSQTALFRFYRSFACLFLGAGLLMQAGSLNAAADKAEGVLLQARSFLGDEACLQAVHALRFVGTISNEEGQVGEIEIVMKKPCQQYQLLRNDAFVTEVGLNDFEAWKKQYEVADPENSRLMMAPLIELKRLRANCLENLSFYSPKRIPGRRVEYLGEIELDGKQAHQVCISYGTVVSFTRHFDVQTGELIMTRLENGEEIRESGETTVQGIRFPKQLITRAPTGQVNTITFTTIEVNPDIDDDIFGVPSMSGN